MGKYTEIKYSNQCVNNPDGWYITHRLRDKRFKFKAVKIYKKGTVAVIRDRSGEIEYFDIENGLNFKIDKISRNKAKFRMSKLWKVMYETN